MKKYFLKKTGEEIKIGGFIKAVVPGRPVVEITFPVTREIIPDLLEMGIIEERTVYPKLDRDKIITHLAKRIEWNRNNLIRYIRNLYKISPSALLSLYLREIAIILDEPYSNHISESEEIWTVGFLNGKPHKVDKSCIKSYKNFAAFRSKEEAEIAAKIMEDAIKDLYGEQED